MQQRFLDILPPALLLALLPMDAHAYLDPGTGSMLLSVVMGLVSTGYFVIRRLPSMIRALFFRLNGKKDDLKNNSIVFYAESKSYWLTFKPVLEALHAKGVKCTYLTSDEADPVFKAGLDDTVHAKFIGKGNTAYTALSFLEADVFALTTPGIDVLQIRRSPGVKQYVHIVHAVGDIHTYKFYSFDYYDAVYCSGPRQAESLRALERLRGTTPKALPLLGCPYLDAYYKRAQKAGTPEPNTVLIAPTWGRNGLLTRTGSRIPKLLAQAGYHVILRPHPQSFISDKDVMEKVASDLDGISNIEWDRNPDGLPSLARASLMVSDVSGVIFDFAFVFLRPVISVGNGPLKEGFEAWEIPHEAWEMEALNEIGCRVPAGEEERIPALVKAMLSDLNSHAEAIRRVRDANVVSFGCAGEKIADALIAASQESSVKAGRRTSAQSINHAEAA